MEIEDSEGTKQKGPVCDENWLENEMAEIVCKKLEFDTGLLERHSAFGAQNETHVMIPTSCPTNATNIQECGTYVEPDDEKLTSCGKDDIAGVFCFQKEKIEKSW